MYRLLAHLSDPSNWADDPVPEPGSTSGLPTLAGARPASMHLAQPNGPFLRAPGPRPHVSR